MFNLGRERFSGKAFVALKDRITVGVTTEMPQATWSIEHLKVLRDLKATPDLLHINDVEVRFYCRGFMVKRTRWGCINFGDNIEIIISAIAVSRFPMVFNFFPK